MTGRSPRLLVRLPAQVIAAVVLGAAIGLVWPRAAQALQPLGTAFISLIRAIVIPLVFCAAASGTAKIAREARVLGRLAAVAGGWFLLASLIALALGLVLDFVFQPGRAVAVTHVAASAAATISRLSWTQFLLAAVPDNLIAQMAGQKVLPTLTFACLFGAALGSVGVERARPVADFLEAALAVMFRITSWVVALAPLAVLAAVAALAATYDSTTAWALGKLILVAYTGYLLLALLCVLGFSLLSSCPLRLARSMVGPALLGFVTRSSEAALPVHMQKLAEAGLSSRTVAIVLPLGYSFNLDGAALYLGVAAGFIAEAHGLHLSVSQRLAVLGTGLLASKGLANVPSAALVGLATVVSALGLPAESIALIAGVDVFLDMGRTALNVFGNTLSVLVVERLATAQPPALSDQLQAESRGYELLPQRSNTPGVS